MIGTRGVLSGAAALVVLVACFAGRSPDPAVELAARALVAERAAATVDALDALEAAMDPGLAAARSGAARVVAGDAPPGPTLLDAARLLREAETDAATVRRAAAALDGAIRGWRPDADGFTAAIERGELGSIASQLQASAPAADEFAGMRLRAERTIATIEDALAALDAGDLDGADRLVGDARTDHDALSAWENELLTLPIWIETTDAMIGDVEAIVAAIRAGDGAAASAAAEAFVAHAAEGDTADRALRIAMSEGGSGVTAAPLARLASTLDAVGRMRAQATAIWAALDR
jgi:hypothetical protein